MKTATASGRTIGGMEGGERPDIMPILRALVLRPMGREFLSTQIILEMDLEMKTMVAHWKGGYH